MKKIHCVMCARLVSVMDIPNPDTVKQMLRDAGNSKTDAKTAIILASAQTLLPMLPPEAYDLLTEAMPQYCPACVVEHNIGQLGEGVRNGEADWKQAQLTDGSGEGGEHGRESGVGSSDGRSSV